MPVADSTTELWFVSSSHVLRSHFWTLSSLTMEIMGVPLKNVSPALMQGQTWLLEEKKESWGVKYMRSLGVLCLIIPTLLSFLTNIHLCTKRKCLQLYYIVCISFRISKTRWNFFVHSHCCNVKQSSQSVHSNLTDQLLDGDQLNCF